PAPRPRAPPRWRSTPRSAPPRPRRRPPARPAPARSRRRAPRSRPRRRPALRRRARRSPARPRNRRRRRSPRGRAPRLLGGGGRLGGPPADDLAAGVGAAGRAHPVRQPRAVAARAAVDRRLAGLVVGAPLVAAGAGGSLL